MPRNALFRGVKAPFPLTHSMKADIKVWQLLVCKHSEDPHTWSPDTPLWLNPQLSEFLTVPDPRFWAARGVKKLDHIFSNGSLLSFDSLKEKFGFTNRQFFRYLQLRHAHTAQFGSLPVLLMQSNLESLLWYKQLVKPTSNIYKALSPSVHFGMEKLFTKWQTVIPDLVSGAWEDAWEYPFLQLISVRDRLIQFKLIHCVFMSPQK